MKKICIMKIKNYYYNQKWDLLVAGTLFLFPIIFFMPIFVKNVNINVGDGIGYEIILNYVRQACQKHEFPFWNRYVAMGTSFVGDIQNKVFYPLTWLSILLPLELAFKFFYVIHISLANLFAYIFCRIEECNKKISVFGAFMFSFSNLIIIRFEHMNILCCLVWVPFIAAMLIQYERKGKLRYLVAMILSMCMQFTAGFPQTSFYSDLFIFALMLYLNFKYGKTLKQYIVDAISVGISYLGLCMVQILPLIEIMQFSGRNEITYEYFSEGAASPYQIFQLFSPTVLGNFANLIPGPHEFPTDAYLGIIPCTLIVFSLIYLRKNKDIVFLFISAGMFLLFASACNIPALGRILYALPVFGSFRTTTRMLAFYVISLMGISILSMREIINKKMLSEYLRVAFTMLFSLVLIREIIRFLGKYRDGEIITFYLESDIFWKSIVLLSLICFFGVILYDRKIGRSFSAFLMIGAVLFQVGDVYFYNTDNAADTWRFSAMLMGDSYEKKFESEVQEKLFEHMAQGNSRYFLNLYSWDDLGNTSWSIRPNVNMLHELPMIQAYITFNNPELMKLMKTDYGMMMNDEELCVVDNPTLASMLNIGYVISRSSQRPLGKYMFDGILYEEYEGRQAYDNLEIPLGKLTCNTNLVVNFDVNVLNDGSDVSLFCCDKLISDLGVLKKENEFYSFSYTADTDLEDISLVLNTGSNIQINGLRVELYSPQGNADFETIYHDEEYILYKNTLKTAPLFVFKNVIQMNQVEEFINENKHNLDFINNAYVEQDKKTYPLSESSGTVEAIKIGENYAEAQVTVNSECGLIGFSESYYPGWNVYVDGKKEEVIKIDGLIQGVYVNKGDHMVSFIYEPKSVQIGLTITVLTAFLWFAWYMVKRRWTKN